MDIIFLMFWKNSPLWPILEYIKIVHKPCVHHGQIRSRSWPLFWKKKLKNFLLLINECLLFHHILQLKNNKSQILGLHLQWLNFHYVLKLLNQFCLKIDTNLTYNKFCIYYKGVINKYKLILAAIIKMDSFL